MRGFVPILAGLLAACASSSSSNTSRAPAPAPARVSYTPDTVRYHQRELRHVEQEVQGQTSSSEIDANSWLTTAVAQMSDSMIATITLDSVNIAVKGVPQSNLQSAADAARGAVFHGTLRPTGELVAFKGPESSSPILSQVTTSLESFFPRLPEHGMSSGDAWADTATTTRDAGGLKITVNAVSEHHATDWTQYAGRRALHVETLTHYKLTGSGNQGGQDLSLEGNGTRHSEQYFAPPGTYLGAITSDTSSFTIMLTQVGMMIPATQHSTDTLTALP